MLFIPSNLADMQKYYMNTFVKFKETGDVLWYIVDISPEKVLCRNKKNDTLEVWIEDSCPFEVDFILPHKSYFQYNDKAMMLHRVPAQQYMRGITPKNTNISQPAAKADNGEVFRHDVTFATLQEFVDKKPFFTLDKAVESSNYSCVLSPRMIYMKNDKAIYVDFTEVALVENRQVKVITPIFTDELLLLVQQCTVPYALLPLEVWKKEFEIMKQKDVGKKQESKKKTINYSTFTPIWPNIIIGETNS